MGSIASFIGGFNGGTRVNRFSITGKIGPKSGGTQTDFSIYHVRSASLPDAILGNIAVNWHGRTVNYPGDRAYKPWNITILDDTGSGAKLYKAFHDWHITINDHASNECKNLTSPRENFASDWSVNHLDASGDKSIKTFTLSNCWPVAIGPLELDMGKDNTIGAFQVTILFSHYTVVSIT